MVKDVISIVVPCFNEKEAIPTFVAEMEKNEKKMSNIDFEYIFINDGSTDDTLSVLKKIKNKSKLIINYISFSRNFGKEAALYAGLSYATGDYVAVMDVDLQDPPEMLEEMYRIIKEQNYDCVGTRRVTREGEPRIRSFFSKKFYQIINKISDTNIVDGARDYRLMTRQMVNSVLDVTEYNRFSKGIFSWVGYTTYYLDYQNIERQEGETSWSFWQLLKYSVEGIISFSAFPLKIATFTGLFSFIISVISAFFIILRAIFCGGAVEGWPSLVVIILAMGGIQLFCLGILGQYLGKLFLEVKKRPIYIVKEESINER